jgi:RNA 2',3'-cyclic 3'-phosphodiesterase
VIRLFVALSLPDDVRDRLAGLCNGLPYARWVDPDSMHITLRFIGEVDHGRYDDLANALSQVRAKRFPVQLSGIGHFGNGGAVRAVWVRVAREPGLMHLHDKIESALVRAGCAPDGQKFTPHVTLTRSRRKPDIRLEEFVVANSLFRAGPFEPRHFTLYSSFLSHNGALYTPEELYPLDDA